MRCLADHVQGVVSHEAGAAVKHSQVSRDGADQHARTSGEGEHTAAAGQGSTRGPCGRDTEKGAEKFLVCIDPLIAIIHIICSSEQKITERFSPHSSC